MLVTRPTTWTGTYSLFHYLKKLANFLVCTLFATWIGFGCMRRMVRDLCWLGPYRSGASFFCVRPELWRVGWHGSGCDLRSVLRSGVSWYGGRG